MSNGDNEITDYLTNDHHPVFLDAVANAAGCDPSSILDLDLYLYDHQKAVSSIPTQTFLHTLVDCNLQTIHFF